MISIKALKKQNSPTDDPAALVTSAREDPAAFGRLYDLYVQRVFGYLYRRVGSQQDAEDLTSQTFIAAYEALESYRGQNHFAAWLFGIARHKLMDHYRRTSAQPPTDDVEDIPKEEHTLDRIIQDEELSRLGALIQHLNSEEQDLIYLRYLAGLSYVEMGELLGKNSDAVKKSVYRLLARLKSQME